jgi:MFS family permease
VYERNVWPTGQVAVGVVVQLAAGALSDSPLLKGRRWPAIIAMQAGGLFGCAIIAAWNVPDSLRFVAYYFSYCTAGVPGPYFSIYSDLIPHDHEMRGFMIAASNMFSYIMVIWYQLAVWRTIDQPKFTAGFTAAAVLGGAMIILTLILRLLLKRDNKRRGKEEHGSDDLETSVSTDLASHFVEGVRIQELEAVKKHGAMAGKV